MNTEPPVEATTSRPPIRLEPATPADAPALTAIQKRAFDEDVRRHPEAPPGGPPGYDDVAAQREQMARGHYFKILDGEERVGGAIVFRTGPASCELGRIWVDPDRQGRGVGGEAMALLERAFPDATVWTLDTPAWATRNQRFYERRGYCRIGEARAGDLVLVLYEKRVNAPRGSGTAAR